MAFFLTRAEHDLLLDVNQPLLQQAFDTCSKRQWSLAGVEFHGLSDGLTENIVDAIHPGYEDDQPEFPRGEFAPQANIGPLW